MSGRFSMARNLGVGLVCLVTTAASSDTLPVILGFDEDGSVRQRALEQKFDGLIEKADLEAWMRRLAARPHHVGSEWGRANAEFMAAQFREWGYETRIEQFDVLFPTPTTRLLEMTAPTSYTARLAEPVLPEDATSGQTDEQLPTYNAYSVNGDVTAPLVYVNYGIPEDYEELARRGIDVEGKIAIARYGGSWRGIKPKLAAEHGAVGCLIYSDPRDDGYFRGDAYPEGSYRGEWGAQRGSVADMPLFPGDPLTPGVGATPEAKRLPLSEAPTLTKIPVLPIAWGDALPLLTALGGPVAPADWRGSLPITYHLGPGPATVHLKVEFDFAQQPALNVIAVMRGREYPDEWVLRGNHHDAWVNGADDPISGMVALMAEAKAIGALVRDGWRPRRTIVFAAWDAEEPGLLGSTEWAEAHAAELRQKAVAYINTDSNGRGFFGAGGSHTLEPFVSQIAREVRDPQTEVSVLDRRRALDLVRADSAAARAKIRDRADLPLSALGSGSDYTPFLQHLGIASLNLGFGGEDGGGSYHSVYDSIDHYTRFGDPGFAYGAALARVAGRAVLRLAEASVLPLSPRVLARTVAGYVDELDELAAAEREEIAERNQQVREKTLALAADPTETYVPPEEETPAPFLNLAPLRNQVAVLTAAADGYARALEEAQAAGRLDDETRRRLNAILMDVEPALALDEGLPGRPWFRHQIYAPGFYTGYGVKTLPAVREAIEQHEWERVDAGVAQTAEAIAAAAAAIDRATAMLRPH